MIRPPTLQTREGASSRACRKGGDITQGPTGCYILLVEGNDVNHRSEYIRRTKMKYCVIVCNRLGTTKTGAGAIRCLLSRNKKIKDLT